MRGVGAVSASVVVSEVPLVVVSEVPSLEAGAVVVVLAAVEALLVVVLVVVVGSQNWWRSITRPCWRRFPEKSVL